MYYVVANLWAFFDEYEGIVLAGGFASKAEAVEAKQKMLEEDSERIFLKVVKGKEGASLREVIDYELC